MNINQQLQDLKIYEKVLENCNCGVCKLKLKLAKEKAQELLKEKPIPIVGEWKNDIL